VTAGFISLTGCMASPADTRGAEAVCEALWAVLAPPV